MTLPTVFNRITLVPLRQLVLVFAAVNVVSGKNENNSFCMDANRSATGRDTNKTPKSQLITNPWKRYVLFN